MLKGLTRTPLLPLSFLAFVAFAMVVGLSPARPMRAQLADAASPPKTWDTSWHTFIDEIERLYRSGTSAAEVDKLFADKDVNWEGEIQEINYPGSSDAAPSIVIRMPSRRVTLRDGTVANVVSHASVDSLAFSKSAAPAITIRFPDVAELEDNLKRINVPADWNHSYVDSIVNFQTTLSGKLIIGRFAIAGVGTHVAGIVTTSKETVLAISTSGAGKVVSGQWWRRPYERVR
jgi:hypothetical protein